MKRIHARTDMSTQLFLKYARNYFCLVILVLLLFIPVYYTAYSSTKEMIVKDSYAKLENVVTELDNRISKLKAITDIIRKDEYINKVALINGTPATEDYYAMQKAKETVSVDLLLGMEDIGQYMIFRDNAIIISGMTVLSDPVYQDYSQYTLAGYDFASWKELVFQDKRAVRYYPAGEITFENRPPMETVICAMKCPGVINKGYDTASIFLLDAEEWGKLLGIEENLQDFLYVSDSDGQILYSAHYQGEKLDTDDEIEEEIEIDGQSYTVLSKSALVNGIHITIGISQKTILSRIAKVNGLIGLYIILSILGMLFFGLWFAIQKTFHMKEVMKSLRREDEKGKVRNEYDYISTAIKGIWKENDGYRQQVGEMRSSIKSGMLERLLTRGIYSEQEKQRVWEYLDWKMEFYCVVCVKGIRERQDYLEDFYVLDCYLRDKFQYVPVNIGMNEQAYIILMHGDESPDTTEVSAVFAETVDSNPELAVGISTVGTGLENLQLCYQQALMAIRRIQESGPRVRVFQANREFQSGQGLCSQIARQNLDNQLADLLQAGEEASVYKLFAKMRGIVERFNGGTEQDMMQLFFSMQVPIARMWEDMDIPDPLPSYSSKKTIAKLLDELEEAACLICSRVAAEKKERTLSKKHEMVSFVDKHFMDQEMCVSFMAERFGMSEKYFSARFKEEAGKNFGSYIEGKRLHLAEEYLLNSDESMYRIAELVGYSTVDAFYKSFRKNYGMAPGKWKEGRKREG